MQALKDGRCYNAEVNVAARALCILLMWWGFVRGRKYCMRNVRNVRNLRDIHRGLWVEIEIWEIWEVIYDDSERHTQKQQQQQKQKQHNVR